MVRRNTFKLPSSRQGYIYGSPETFISKLPPEVLETLTNEQRSAIYTMLAEALPQSSPKLVDIRWTLNLLFGRYLLCHERTPVIATKGA